MTDQIELLFQTMRFTPLLGVLDLLLILHFFGSWYFASKKTGWKIDFWYLTFILGIFPSMLVLYPFSASIYNFNSTLGLIDNIAPFIDQAFLITILGYACIWLGRYTFDLTRGRFPFIALFQLGLPLCQLFEKNVKNRRAFQTLVFGTLILGIVILGVQFANGEFFNGRRFFLGSPQYRPFFNATISLFPIAILFSSLRFVQYKERSALKLLLIFSALSLFFGVRSILLGGFLCLVMLQSFQQEGRVNLKKVILAMACLFLLAVMLSHLREGNYSVAQSLGSLFFNFFYGNNLSDTRDFAWILSAWDGEYLYGKSYIAALLSFIPRSLISLREEWGISMYTNTLIGFSSDVMPGLRPGLFGESFLNFGLFGVVLFGWVFGFALRYVDVKIKEFVGISKDIIKGYSHSVMFSLISALAITAGIWTFYIFILVNFALVPFRKFLPGWSYRSHRVESQ